RPCPLLHSIYICWMPSLIGTIICAKKLTLKTMGSNAESTNSHVHDGQETQLSPLWRRKMKTFFDTIDKKGNGVIRKSDFCRLLTRINQNIPFIVLYRQISAFTKAFEHIVLNIFWAEMATRGGDIGDSRTVDFDEFTHNICMNLKQENVQVFKEVLDYIAVCFFKLIAVNRDQEISVDEYILFLGLFGVHEEFPINWFESIDTNCNGSIGLIELRSAFFDFWLGQNVGPGTYLLGRLL
ncbi:unnamed protein product, partial [Owenia fusiformis]